MVTVYLKKIVQFLFLVTTSMTNGFLLSNPVFFFFFFPYTTVIFIAVLGVGSKDSHHSHFTNTGPGTQQV